MLTRQLFTKVALGAVLVILVDWWLMPYFKGALHPNPIWFSWGQFQLYWYGLLMSISVLLGFWIVLRVNRGLKLPLDPDKLFYAVVITIISGFVGARLLFVILEWPTYAQHLTEIWQVNHGGMSIHGALLGGLLGLWAACRWQRLELFRTTDLMVLALPIGQAIGRFGNFFNQEAFGGPTNLPWKMFVEPAFRPPEFLQTNFFHPTFLYESVGNLIIASILWRVFSRHQQQVGLTTAWYLILYSGWRFIVEWWRVDSVKWHWLTLAQWASLGIILVAIIWLIKLNHHERA